LIDDPPHGHAAAGGDEFVGSLLSPSHRGCRKNPNECLTPKARGTATL
jgi:hypothetical protein